MFFFFLQLLWGKKKEIRVWGQLPQSKRNFLLTKADWFFCLRNNQTACKPYLRDVNFGMLREATYRQIKEAVHGATRPRSIIRFLKNFEINLPATSEHNRNRPPRKSKTYFAFADQLEARIRTAQTRIDR